MKGIKRKVFPNGLVLLTEFIPSEESAVLLVSINVGSINEDDKFNGASHFTEHLLFKSNAYRNKEQLSSDLEFDGSQINAFTDNAKTVFYAETLPDPAKLNRALEVSHQAVTNLQYDQEEFELEKSIILQGIQLDFEDPKMHTHCRLFEPSLFKGTSLERTVGGTEESVGALSVKKMVQFKKRFYTPNNMVLVVAGKFDEKELIKKVEETFGRIPSRDLPEQNLVFSQKNVRTEILRESSNIRQVYLDLGFKVPSLAYNDFHKLKLLDGVLSLGMSSRLFQELRERRGIGYFVGSNYDSYCKETAIFYACIYGFDPKYFKEAVSIIEGEFKDLKTNLIKPEELERIKNQYRSLHVQNMRMPVWRANRILDLEYYGPDYDYRQTADVYDRITSQELLEAARKYLIENYTLAVLAPEGFFK